jgi:hypothetical protein
LTIDKGSSGKEDGISKEEIGSYGTSDLTPASRDTRYEIRDTRYEIRDTRYEIRTLQK